MQIRGTIDKPLQGLDREPAGGCYRARGQRRGRPRRAARVQREGASLIVKPGWHGL